MSASTQPSVEGLPQPFATLHDDGHWTMRPGVTPYNAYFAGWREDVYSAAQLRAYAERLCAPSEPGEALQVLRELVEAQDACSGAQSVEVWHEEADRLTGAWDRARALAAQGEPK